MDERISSFEPIYDVYANLLILGTMPSEESLRQSFYYAHPRNCFWRMMADILREDVPIMAEQKRALLTRHGIALWDVAKSCVRQGSLDSAIKEAVPNEIAKLLSECPRIGTILFNGGTAAKLFRQMLPGCGEGLIKVQMPSTSPAYTLPYDRKRAEWAREISALIRVQIPLSE